MVLRWAEQTRYQDGLSDLFWQGDWGEVGFGVFFECLGSKEWVLVEQPVNKALFLNLQVCQLPLLLQKIIPMSCGTNKSRYVILFWKKPPTISFVQGY